MNDNPLGDYLSVLWRRKVIFLLAVLVVATTAFLLSNRQQKVYSASAQILLSADSNTNNGGVETEKRVLVSDAVRAVAAKKVPNLASASASSVTGSRIMIATVESTVPQLAADSANAYVAAYIEYSLSQQVSNVEQSISQAQAKLAELRPQLDAANVEYLNAQQEILDEFATPSSETAARKAERESQRSLALQNLGATLGPKREALNAQVLVVNSQLIDLAVKDQVTGASFATVVSPATEPSQPIRPSPVRDTGVGIALGLLLGAALAFGFDLLEDTIKSRFDVERAVGSEPTVIAAVPASARRKGSDALSVLTDPFSPASEAYRSLRTSVQFLGLERPLHTVSVTSPSVGDGKTTTIANLAVVTARTGKRVVLVDADLRRPRIHDYFGLHNDRGLTSVMIGDCNLQDALQELPDVPRMSVLTSGPLPPNPSELLSTRRFPEVVGLLRDYADLVFIDSPPLLPVTDPAIIAAHVDGVIVVVSEGSTSRRQLRQAFSTLRQVDATPVGIVLNNSESDSTASYGYYHQSQAPPRTGRSWRPRRKRDAPRAPEPIRETPTGNGSAKANREAEPSRRRREHLIGASTAGAADAMRDPALRSVAFYLPQYHPIRENDEWWGAGFTEWRNVVKARPLFRGHEQPQLPADLGFYDLRVPETRAAQAQLASRFGIDAFCYYHYWFEGRRLLDQPFASVLDSGEPDFPFCLCWANENWTRAWNGKASEPLLSQTYSDDDDVAHARWMAQAFSDPRYVRVDGRPLFLVYRTAALPDARRTADRWRAEITRLGVSEPYLCAVQSTATEHVDPATLGFDAAVEFAPDYAIVDRLRGDPAIQRALRRAWARESTRRRNHVLPYQAMVDAMLAKPDVPYTRYRCVSPGFDNSSRRADGGALILTGSTPDAYRSWVTSVVSRQAADDGLLFVAAWNEWAEGNHLEPCQRWGTGFLEAHLAGVLSDDLRRRDVKR